MLPSRRPALPFSTNTHLADSASTLTSSAPANALPPVDGVTRREVVAALRRGGVLADSVRHIALSGIPTLRGWPPGVQIQLTVEGSASIPPYGAARSPPDPQGPVHVVRFADGLYVTAGPATDGQPAPPPILCGAQPDSVFEAVLQGLRRRNPMQHEVFRWACSVSTAMPGGDAELVRQCVAGQLEFSRYLIESVVRALHAHAQPFLQPMPLPAQGSHVSTPWLSSAALEELRKQVPARVEGERNLTYARRIHTERRKLGLPDLPLEHLSQLSEAAVYELRKRPVFQAPSEALEALRSQVSAQKKGEGNFAYAMRLHNEERPPGQPALTLEQIAQLSQTPLNHLRYELVFRASSGVQGEFRGEVPERKKGERNQDYARRIFKERRESGLPDFTLQQIAKFSGARVMHLSHDPTFRAPSEAVQQLSEHVPARVFGESDQVYARRIHKECPGIDIEDIAQLSGTMVTTLNRDPRFWPPSEAVEELRGQVSAQHKGEGNLDYAKRLLKERREQGLPDLALKQIAQLAEVEVARLRRNPAFQETSDAVQELRDQMSARCDGESGQAYARHVHSERRNLGLPDLALEEIAQLSEVEVNCLRRDPKFWEPSEAMEALRGQVSARHPGESNLAYGRRLIDERRERGLPDLPLEQIAELSRATVSHLRHDEALRQIREALWGILTSLPRLPKERNVPYAIRLAANAHGVTLDQLSLITNAPKRTLRANAELQALLAAPQGAVTGQGMASAGVDILSAAMTAASMSTDGTTTPGTTNWDELIANLWPDLLESGPAVSNALSPSQEAPSFVDMDDPQAVLVPAETDRVPEKTSAQPDDAARQAAARRELEAQTRRLRHRPWDQEVQALCFKLLASHPAWPAGLPLLYFADGPEGLGIERALARSDELPACIVSTLDNLNVVQSGRIRPIGPGERGFEGALHMLLGSAREQSLRAALADGSPGMKPTSPFTQLVRQGLAAYLERHPTEALAVLRAPMRGPEHYRAPPASLLATKAAATFDPQTCNDLRAWVEQVRAEAPCPPVQELCERLLTRLPDWDKKTRLHILTEDADGPRAAYEAGRSTHFNPHLEHGVVSITCNTDRSTYGATDTSMLAFTRPVPAGMPDTLFNALALSLQPRINVRDPATGKLHAVSATRQSIAHLAHDWKLKMARFIETHDAEVRGEIEALRTLHAATRDD
jgi:hypothetical protein